MIIDPETQAFREEFDSWPAKPNIWDHVFTVTARYFDTEDPPLWTPLLSPHHRRRALYDRKDTCLNCGHAGHSVRHCEESFLNVHGLMNPELGTLNDDNAAFRRWQIRMRRYRTRRDQNNPDSRSTRPHRRYGSGRPRSNPPSETNRQRDATSSPRYEQRDGRPTRVGAADRDPHPNGRHPGTFVTDREK